MVAQTGFSAYATHATAATATYTNPKATAWCCVTTVTGSTDLPTAVVTVQDEDTTVLASWTLTAAGPFTFSIPDGVWTAAAGTNIVGTCSGTALAKVTISGYWR